jgi:hypothetical protein
LQGATGPQGPAGTGGGTLDAAYDFGGAGSGRTITADAGSVTINSNGTGTAGIALNVNQTGTSTAAVGALIGGTGNAINASSTNANNSFATIQATTNSATLNNSAVLVKVQDRQEPLPEKLAQMQAQMWRYGEIICAQTEELALRAKGIMGCLGLPFETMVMQFSARIQGFPTWAREQIMPWVLVALVELAAIGMVALVLCP